MDTSETYIKMCDCEEIQGQWKKLDGDVFYGSGWWGYATPMILFDANSCCMILPKEDAIWLPRQDQIQEMIGITNAMEFNGIYFNHINVEGSSMLRELNKEFLSMEQVFLMWYMWNKHHKKWNWDSSQWVKK